jgi:hypothetical protein
MAVRLARGSLLASLRVVAAGLLPFAIIGCASGPAPTPEIVPGPVRTVLVPGPVQTILVPGPVRTVLVPGPVQTIPVATVPDACIAALNEANRLITNYTQIAQPLISASANGSDIFTLAQAVQDIMAHYDPSTVDPTEFRRLMSSCTS